MDQRHTLKPCLDFRSPFTDVLVTAATAGQPHLDRFKHLVEVKFGDGLFELLLRLDPVEEFTSLHPEGRANLLAYCGIL